MKLETRIVVYDKNNSNHQNCIRILQDFLYNVVINQNITIFHDGKQVECKVISVNDSVYNDIIYRYVEVVLLK